MGVVNNMDLDNIVMIPSKSRFDLEVEKWGTIDAARKRFVGEIWEKVVGSHHTQRTNIQKIAKRLGNRLMYDRSQLTPEMVGNFSAFAFLGGDDHFKYCAHVILKYMQEHPDEEKYVIGVRLSPRSVGALLHFDTDTFLESLPKLEKDDFSVENWTTLEARVLNGESAVVLYPAIGDYFVGEYGRLFMSRNEVYLDGQKVFPDKSSGILLAVGAGSDEGSWYDNIHRTMFGNGNEFGREEEIARAILTEEKSKSKLTLNKGQTLEIYSYNDSRGIVCPDSCEDHSADFGMGSKAEIKVSDLKLKVIRAN
jgi:hypothetical protein